MATCGIPLLPYLHSPNWQRTFCLWSDYVDKDVLGG